MLLSRMLGFQFRSAPVELIRCIMYILLGWYLDKVEISKKHVVIFDAFSILIMVGTSVFGYRVNSIQYNDVATVFCLFLFF